MVAIENIFVKYIKLRSRLNEAKIYKITDRTNDNIYIGSTCRSFKKRLSEHKSEYKRFLKGLYSNIKSFDIIKNNDYKIELIENCEITTKQELLERERYYIQDNECLNNNIPGRTDKEYQQYQKDYYNENKDELTIKRKEYNDKNKDKLNEKIKCPCGGNYTNCNKSHHLRSNKHKNYLQSLK